MRAVKRFVESCQGLLRIGEGCGELLRVCELVEEFSRVIESYHGGRATKHGKKSMLQHNGLSHYVIRTHQTIPSFVFSPYTFHLHHPRVMH